MNLNVTKSAGYPSKDILLRRIEKFFDQDYYLKCYPDVASTDIKPIDHYLKSGWRENRRPNRWFHDSMVPPALQAANTTTPIFMLFLIHLPGLDETSFETLCNTGTPKDTGHTSCWECNEMLSRFDGQYYRRRYPDISQEQDALIHYCEKGWREGRNPAATFDTMYYITSNKDVAAAGINPFVHYCSVGHTEGRSGRPSDPVRRNLLRSLRGFDDLSRDYRKNKPFIKFIDSSDLFIALWKGKGRVCVTVSHDDYLKHTGGVQKFIRDESQHAQDAGMDYLHISPAIPDVRLSQEGVYTFLVHVNLNDSFLGTFSAKDVAEAFDSIQRKRPEVMNVGILHSAMGWSPDVLELLLGKRFSRMFFYVHDYHAFCPEYRLLRNNLTPCDGPDIESNVCNICVHAGLRAEHVKGFEHIFKAITPIALYPSKTAQKIFETAKPAYGLKGMVVPHISVSILRSTSHVPGAKQTDSNRPIRVAYCGHPAPHKGWQHFLELANQLLTYDGYEFYMFGSHDPNEPWLKHVSVALRNGVSTMTEKLLEHDIDIVFVGSTWRETFNFVAHEAARAGAAIMTLKNSGHVAEFVRTFKIGVVVDDWKEAIDVMVAPDFRTKLPTWRNKTRLLVFKDNKSFLSDEATN
ncbi:MAG: hypothetical protein ACOY3Z_09150 [Thermodesulfobacteriota bacterium]